MRIKASMLDEYGLTPRQRAWCDYYIETGNAVDAAKKAGYKSPKHSAIDNRDKPPCKSYIAMRMQPKVDRRIASADDVLQFLTDTMQGRIKDQFGLEASLQDRISAAKELMKRYAVADQRAQGTMAKLDAILLEFTTAIQAPGAISTPDTTAPPAVTVQGSMPTVDTTDAPATDE